MCRINGILAKSISEDVMINSRDSLSYGGPDDAGTFIDSIDGIGLGQRRLSIIDLTAGGHQPMIYKEFVIVFNGEIYNFEEIRNSLTNFGIRFNSNSDTEVILKAFEKWGYSCVNLFRGMFAFAIWNKKTKKLLLCRDRIGVKPLYWYQKEGLFMFASELKAFHFHPDFDKTINQQAVSLYLQTGYIRSPFSIFKYAHKLEPGSFLEINENGEIKTWKYWELRSVYNNIEVNKDNESTVISACENILTESFNLRMVSDVPVGVFLSGGIDSSLVAALLQKDSLTPLKTFTIGIHNKFLNEAPFANQIAKYLGTEHTELYCTEDYFKDLIPRLAEIYDEPFGDSSCIPTFLVSELAKKSVKVSLSADGGDEIFAGYNRYLIASQMYSKLSKIPKSIRGLLGNGLEKLDFNQIEYIISKLPINENYKRNIDARLPKLIETIKANSLIDFVYNSTVFITPKALNRIHFGCQKVEIFNRDLNFKPDQKFSTFAIADIESYLEGDIMTKVDRATMRVALEGREPFLDHKIIEFALGLQDHFKIRNGETKWILRQILHKFIPKEYYNRPKMGFGIPLDNWLSTFLKNELEQLYHDKNFCEVFCLNQVIVEREIALYLNKKGFNSHFIWYLYVLHQWYKKWI